MLIYIKPPAVYLNKVLTIVYLSSIFPAAQKYQFTSINKKGKRLI